MHYAQKETHLDFYLRWDTVGKKIILTDFTPDETLCQRENHPDRLVPQVRLYVWIENHLNLYLRWEKTTVTDINLKWQTMLEKKTTLTLKYLIQVCVCVYICMYVSVQICGVCDEDGTGWMCSWVLCCLGVMIVCA